MPQKVKISTGYSDKVSKDFNSQQFSVSLEMECAINGSTKEIQDASKRLFELCRRIVNDQKGVSVDGLLQQEDDSMYPPQTAATVPATPVPQGQANGQTGAPSVRNITTKQISYLFRLGQKAGLSDEQVRQLPVQYFGRPDLQSLTSYEASKLIDTLGDKKKVA